jgi:hypothetical protein
VATTEKLGLSFYAYVRDRLTAAHQVPALDHIIAARAPTLQRALLVAGVVLLRFSEQIPDSRNCTAMAAASVCSRNIYEGTAQYSRHRNSIRIGNLIGVAALWIGVAPVLTAGRR